jgi:hypothetical protein
MKRKVRTVREGSRELKGLGPIFCLKNLALKFDLVQYSGNWFALHGLLAKCLLFFCCDTCNVVWIGQTIISCLGLLVQPWTPCCFQMMRDLLNYHSSASLIFLFGGMFWPLIYIGEAAPWGNNMDTVALCLIHESDCK